VGAIWLAAEMGWPHRAEWVRAEFGVSGSSAAAAKQSSITVAASSDSRRLAALEQLSVTASRILDPNELTRVALDETIRMLSAERAYLFLTNAENDGLVPHLGRDEAGRDLDTLTDYGSTIVERVRHSREAVIVTGTDEGAALGSKSVVAHGLRSIMAAPLQFDGRLLGVVYLDSRVAKGIFTETDVGILTAVTNHIAAALETARAAQLAVAVMSAERQRDIADKLRRAMVELSGSLDPDDVLRRLHAILVQLLPGVRSNLLLARGDKFAVASGGVGHDPSNPIVAVDTESSRMLRADVPVAGDRVPDEPLIFGAAPADGSWLAVPLRTRDEYLGALVLVADRPQAYGPTECQLAGALTGEAMVAYDNARLFAQVELAATTDGLTGVHNRRHFFTMAERDVAAAGGSGTSMAVVMLDIDHFKLVNDQYGHHVGDQVIQAVARRLKATLRTDDRFGRYGGEEFALLLPDLAIHPADLGERLRRAVAEEPVGTNGGPLPVTVSVGVCTFEPGLHSLNQALNLADVALYRAKKEGRNRVACDVAADVLPAGL
jgi:diguanylate cyclase (GGDEF)-like protein